MTKDDPHTLISCSTGSVYILQMMLQSIANDVTMQSYNLTIVMPAAHDKRYLPH